MLRTISTFVAAVGLSLSISACAESGHPRFAEGTHYELLDVPVAVDDPGRIEVREFFSYACPHCFDAELIVSDWAKNAPGDVDFVRTPVLFLRGSEPLARAFYVAQAKGILDKIHRPLFDAIHKHREPLFTVPALAGFFRQYGVEPDEFNELYGSFGVSTRIRKADSLAREYQITGVPAFVVNGKYRILRQNLRNDIETFKVIDHLVGKERAATAK